MHGNPNFRDEETQGLKPIKASELVKILQDKIEKDGDLPVYLPADPIAYHDSEKLGEHEVVCVGANTWCDYDTETGTRIMLMDPGAADALG